MPKYVPNIVPALPSTTASFRAFDPGTPLAFMLSMNNTIANDVTVITSLPFAADRDVVLLGADVCLDADQLLAFRADELVEMFDAALNLF